MVGLRNEESEDIGRRFLLTAAAGAGAIGALLGTGSVGTEKPLNARELDCRATDWFTGIGTGLRAVGWDAEAEALKALFVFAPTNQLDRLACPASRVVPLGFEVLPTFVPLSWASCSALFSGTGPLIASTSC